MRKKYGRLQTRASPDDEPDQILTDHLHERIAIEDGDKRPDSTRDLVRIAVVERHGRNGNIATGFVKGFGLQAGAIASTVCHDHHNIACVGVGYDDGVQETAMCFVCEQQFELPQRGVLQAASPG